jgi:hypothetical protein
MKKLHTLCRLGVALAILSPALFAQERGGSEPSVAFEASQSFAAWNAEHGSNWHTYTDVQTGYVQFLFGGSTEAAFEPTSDGQFFELGRLAIEDTQDLHGIESATLIEDRTLHLPLGSIGSSDKFTVRFRQEVQGVPVLGGFVNALLTPGGKLLSVQSSAMPGVAGLSTDAVVGADSAIRQALGEFQSTTGVQGKIVSGPTKVIGQLETGLKHRAAILVWQVDVLWTQDGSEPEGYSYWIDARNGGVVKAETTIHNLDVGGTITTMSTPGILPDQANNPEVPFPVNRARVVGSGGAGTVYTDQNGNFNFPGVAGPITVTVGYLGNWCTVDNVAGAEYTLGVSATGTGNNLLMNPTSSALITAQSNCFQIIGAQRDWIRSVNPSDSTGDFQAQANANLSSTCNAFFDGVSVNMYQAGGGCPNTAYSTVVSHEMGHWYNVLYGTGNGSDGMGEGNADVFSLYMYNTPNLGMDFQGQGNGPLRNGNNTLQFCGDASPGCHGGAVHTEGQVWMGAAWKIYLHLETAYGSAQADMITDALFLGWMNSYNQTQIKSVIETQWLTLDDNNGNINDGTPHYTEIDNGFKQQGFPGFDLPLINIISVTDLPDQLSEVGPYNVDVNVVSLIGQTITGVALKYSVNGGAFSTIAMSSSGVDTWSAGIPGQNSPAVVRYYVEATDSLANTDVSPEDAPADTLKFVIGIETVFFSENFEGGQGGWTHNTFGDTSNSQDDWQFGTPGGQSGDPGSAASGVNAWGNDLSIGNFNGAYQNNVHNYLRSPSINCSAAVGTVLRYKRWLTVEEGIFDQARIKINGTQVWVNASSGNHTDTSWDEHEIDISAIADGNPAVQIEFSLQSDGGLTFGGWTIDDVELLFLEPVGGGCSSSNYGTGKLSSIFTFPTITAVNDASEAANNFMLSVDLAVPDKFGLVFSSNAPDSTPLLGGTLLVAQPLKREGSFVTDVFGSAIVAQPLLAGSSGTTRYFQAWYRDPAHTDGIGVGLTNGLEVHICD